MGNRNISLYRMRLRYIHKWKRVARFVADVSAVGKRESTVWFECDSPEEKYFLEKVGRKRKWLINNRFRMITKSRITDYGFYELNSGFPPRSLRLPMELTYVAECPTCQTFPSHLRADCCPVFGYAQMRGKDIFRIAEMGLALIISARMKELLQEANLGAVQLVPCGDEKVYREDPSVAVRTGPFPLSDAPEADFYQAIINESVSGPMEADAVEVWDECKVCGLKAFLVDGVSWFTEHNLRRVPFQACQKLRESSGKEFDLERGPTIVSNEVMRIIVENKLKSLISVNPGPRVLYPVVETEKTVSDLRRR